MGFSENSVRLGGTRAEYWVIQNPTDERYRNKRYGTKKAALADAAKLKEADQFHRPVRQAARRLRQARQEVKGALESARRAALDATAAGAATEAELARQLGVNRATVRRWRGK